MTVCSIVQDWYIFRLHEEWNTVEECMEHIFHAHPKRKQSSGCSKQIPLFKPLNGEQNYTPISYAGAKYCMLAFQKQESQLNVSSLLKNIVKVCSFESTIQKHTQKSFDGLFPTSVLFE